MPEVAARPETETRTPSPALGGLTIAEAKKALAATLGVKSEAVEITVDIRIRG
jgi:hypothetical protein